MGKLAPQYFPLKRWQSFIWGSSHLVLQNHSKRQQLLWSKLPIVAQEMMKCCHFEAQFVGALLLDLVHAGQRWKFPVLSWKMFSFSCSCENRIYNKLKLYSLHTITEHEYKYEEIWKNAQNSLQETQSIQGSTQTHSSQEFGLNFRHVLRCQSAPAAAAAAAAAAPGPRGPRRRELLRPLRTLGPDAEDAGKGPGLRVVLGTVRGHGEVGRIQEDTMEDSMGSMGRCGLLMCLEVFWCMLMYVWICHILHMVVWKDWKLCNIYASMYGHQTRQECHAMHFMNVPTSQAGVLASQTWTKCQAAKPSGEIWNIPGRAVQSETPWISPCDMILLPEELLKITAWQTIRRVIDVKKH